MPDLVGVFRQLDPLQLRLAFVVEEAELDLGGVGGEQGEVDAEPVPGRAEGEGPALPNGRPPHLWSPCVHGTLALDGPHKQPGGAIVPCGDPLSRKG